MNNLCILYFQVFQYALDKPKLYLWLFSMVTFFFIWLIYKGMSRISRSKIWCFCMMHLLNYAHWKHWFTLCHCIAGVLFTETSECCAQFDRRTSSIFNEGLRGDEEAASVRIEEPKCTRLSCIGSDSSVSCLSVLILREFTAHCVEWCYALEGFC